MTTRTDQLRPPMRVVPGACSCSPSTGECVCAPEDLAQKMSDFTFARYAAEEAKERGDARAERMWRAEFQRLGEVVRRAIEPQPQHARKDSDMTHDPNDRPFTLRRFRATKLGASTPPLRRSDARDSRAQAWREQWRQPLGASREDVLFGRVRR
jgi:hypothetical protein